MCEFTRWLQYYDKKYCHKRHIEKNKSFTVLRQYCTRNKQILAQCSTWNLFVVKIRETKLPTKWLKWNFKFLKGSESQEFQSEKKKIEWGQKTLKIFRGKNLKIYFHYFVGSFVVRIILETAFPDENWRSNCIFCEWRIA